VIKWTFALISFLICLILLSENLTLFPPYFFCDEAIHGVEAQSILHSARDSYGVRFPIFFQGFGDYQLSFSIYFQAVFNWFFGLNEFAVRARSVFLSLLFSTTLFVWLNKNNKSEFNWIIFFTFLLSPVWFLHSRAGFESLQATVFISIATILLFEGFKNNKYGLIFFSAVCFAASFYSYIPARVWVCTFLIALFFINLRTIFSKKKLYFVFIFSFLILLIPYGYFHCVNPQGALRRMQSVGFKEFMNKTFFDQSLIVVKNYLRALDPMFWFTWSGTINDGPQQRHIIPQLALLPNWYLPFSALGLILIFRHFAYNFGSIFIVLAITTPIVCAPFEITNLRLLPIAVSYILFASIGIIYFLDSLSRKFNHHNIFKISILCICSVWSFQYRDYIYNQSPRLYTDYRFYGIQYGAHKIFSWISTQDKKFTKYYISSSLFNAGDIFPKFYLSSDLQKLTSIEDQKHLCRRDSKDKMTNSIWVIEEQFFRELNKERCPFQYKILQEFLDPNSKPIYLAVLRQPNPDNSNLTEENSQLELYPNIGEFPSWILNIKITPLDIGSPANLFDNSLETLVRTSGINPLNLELEMNNTGMNTLSVVYSNNHKIESTLKVFSRQGEFTFKEEKTNAEEGNWQINFQFPQKLDVTKIFLTIRALDADEFGYVHLKEIYKN
jgi:hypothetical protein